MNRVKAGHSERAPAQEVHVRREDWNAHSARTGPIRLATLVISVRGDGGPAGRGADVPASWSAEAEQQAEAADRRARVPRRGNGTGEDYEMMTGLAFVGFGDAEGKEGPCRVGGSDRAAGGHVGV